MRFFSFFVFVIASTAITACNQSSRQPASNPVKKVDIRHKPPSNYQDTLLISGAAAVFYHPDSLQLEQIRELTEKNTFEGSMHEYESMIRNAQAAIHNVYPDIPIIEAKNVRYLQFRVGEDSSLFVDLNGKDDAYGLFLFKPGKAPLLTDMTNIDSQLPYYFSH